MSGGPGGEGRRGGPGAIDQTIVDPTGYAVTGGNVTGTLPTLNVAASGATAGLYTNPDVTLLADGRASLITAGGDINAFLCSFARQKFGCTPLQLVTLFQPVSARANGGTPGGSITGSAGTVADVVGAKKYPTNVVASAKIGISFASSASGSMFPSGSSAKWLLAGRYKFAEAITATTQGGVCAISANNNVPAAVELNLGVYGPGQTAKYSLRGNAGADILSAVSVDQSYHDFLAFSDGTHSFISVDQETLVQGTANPAAVSSPGWWVGDTVGAATHSITIQYMFAATVVQ